MTDDFLCHKIQQIFPEICSIRRLIHQNPELSFGEFQTAALVKRFLESHGISFRDGIAKTGILAEIHGSLPGKTLLIRADMDALPLTEETALPYASEVEGVMHACGHDAHTAILLGTAALLQEMRGQFCGTVKLVFQPGEEESGGALPMIESGILENPNVDACLALHVSPLADAGDILIKSGEITASPDDFEIKVIGKGGHGASPQETIDPIAIGCQIVNALLCLPTRTIDPSVSSVLSIGSFQAGSFPNIIPDTACIKGTFRTTSETVRIHTAKLIESVVKQYTAAVGAEYELEYHYLFPPAVNDESLTDRFVSVAQNALGCDHVIDQGHPYMIGEDFAYFGKYAPSVLFHLGCKNEESGAVYPLHSAKFQIDEACMKTGMELFLRFALDFCGEN